MPEEDHDAARRAEAHEKALNARVRELEEAGWPIQVPVLEGGVNLFVEAGSGRERLYREDGGFRLRHAGTKLGLEELLAQIERSPDTVSPNVLLRPVVEAAVLPTVGYVAGPAETAYLGEIGPLFESHGILQPMVFPRLSAMMVAKVAGSGDSACAANPARARMSRVQARANLPLRRN